jgi:Putative transposase DNA-binding domain
MAREVERHRPLVGREQQGSLRIRAGRSRTGAQALERLTNRPPQGPPVGFPRPKKKNRDRDSCRFTTGQITVLADRLYPSSKTCSACGWVRAKLTLAERTVTCEDCGLVLDRDVNAARDLTKLAQDVAQSGWETRNARGADRRTQPAGQVALKREPSSTDIRLGPTASLSGRDMIG